MENSPFSPLPTPEAGSKPADSEKKDKKTSKKSKAIGSLAFEQPAPVSEKKPEDKKSEPLAEKTSEATKPETSVDQKSELSAEDTEYALHEVAVERQAEVEGEPVAEDAESLAAHAAAEEFYAKIVDEGLPLEAVVAEMIPGHDMSDGAAEAPRGTAEEAEDDDAGTTTKAGTPAPATAIGASGGSTPPPRVPPSPSSPLGGSPPHGPTPPHSPVSPAYAVPLTPNNPPTPSVVTRTEYVPYYDRSRAFSDALVGGIVGYLIGRRRGRIKTERKLLPVQHKLEREVTSLTQRLANSEFAVREAAKQKVREKQQAPQPLETVIRIRDRQATPEAIILGRREQPLPAPELHTKQRYAAPSERIGKVLIAAEAVASTGSSVESPRIEKQAVETHKVDSRSTEQQVETLSRNELMTLSEKVIVEGSTLRQVYETHLISERGLRRLITEYLRGGDVVKAFRRELIEREIDFERDPKLRDTVRKNLTGGGASPTLNKLLQQAGVAPVDESPQEISRARAQQLRDVKQQAKRASNRKLIDVSLITIIAVLLAVIIVLGVHRI